VAYKEDRRKLTQHRCSAFGEGLHASADRDHSDRTIMITGIGDVIT